MVMTYTRHSRKSVAEFKFPKESPVFFDLIKACSDIDPLRSPTALKIEEILDKFDN